MIEKDQLKQLLLEQREVILQKPFGIEREILGKIEKKIGLPHIIVLTGLRRSGKSTVLRQLMKKYYYDRDFYYINFEDERLLNFRAQEFNMIYEALIELFGEKKTFFIDEIQNAPNFESFVRRFYDAGFKFYITGSNAGLLRREIGSKLTGRHLDMAVKPFSFKEFLAAKQFKFEKDMLFKTSDRVQLKKHFGDYLLKGGMPEFALYNDPEVLARVYEDIVIKDISVRYNIENSIQLRELYQYLITNFSNKFSFNSLKKFIGIGSSNTIKKYIDFLEQTYFVAVINKFDYSLKKQIINDKKIYVLDNGFIHIISTKATSDKGWLMENIVFNQLNSSFDVFYYGNKHECDFIALKDKKVHLAVQVCWELTPSNKGREVDGLLEAMKKLRIKEGWILTHDQEEEIVLKGKKISVKPVWKWMLEG